MAINIASNSGKYHWALKQLICDTPDDIPNLPVDDTVWPGSTAYIISTYETYMFTGHFEWVKVATAPGGGGGSGRAATIQIEDTYTGAPGTDASVENLGDENAAILRFTIPRGDPFRIKATYLTAQDMNDDYNNPDIAIGDLVAITDGINNATVYVKGSENFVFFLEFDSPVAIQGEQGTPGEKGEKGDTGDPFIYEDFTPAQLEGLRGPAGADGAPGQDGDPGPAGEDGRGIATIEFTGDAQDVMVITLDDGSTQFTSGSLLGPRGLNGSDGQPGVSIVSVSSPSNGVITVTLSNGNTYSVNVSTVPGPQGDTGPKGDTGATGAKGDTGEQGPAGADGADGITPTIAGGTVTIAPAGTSPSVTISGTSENPIFNFVLPAGNTTVDITNIYSTKAAADADIGNINDGDLIFIIDDGVHNPGNIYVKNGNQLVFMVSLGSSTVVEGPTGPAGADGITPTISVGTVTTSPDGDPHITLDPSSTSSNAIFNFELPSATLSSLNISDTNVVDGNTKVVVKNGNTYYTTDVDNIGTHTIKNTTINTLLTPDKTVDDAINWLFNNKVDKNTTIAGISIGDGITQTDLRDALNLGDGEYRKYVIPLESCFKRIRHRWVTDPSTGVSTEEITLNENLPLTGELKAVAGNGLVIGQLTVSAPSADWSITDGSSGTYRDTICIGRMDIGYSHNDPDIPASPLAALPVPSRDCLFLYGSYDQYNIGPVLADNGGLANLRIMCYNEAAQREEIAKIEGHLLGTLGPKRYDKIIFSRSFCYPTDDPLCGGCSHHNIRATGYFSLEDDQVVGENNINAHNAAFGQNTALYRDDAEGGYGGFITLVSGQNNTAVTNTIPNPEVPGGYWSPRPNLISGFYNTLLGGGGVVAFGHQNASLTYPRSYNLISGARNLLGPEEQNELDDLVSTESKGAHTVEIFDTVVEVSLETQPPTYRLYKDALFTEPITEPTIVTLRGDNDGVYYYKTVTEGHYSSNIYHKIEITGDIISANFIGGTQNKITFDPNLYNSLDPSDIPNFLLENNLIFGVDNSLKNRSRNTAIFGDNNNVEKVNDSLIFGTNNDSKDITDSLIGGHTISGIDVSQVVDDKESATVEQGYVFVRHEVGSDYYDLYYKYDTYWTDLKQDEQEPTTGPLAIVNSFAVGSWNTISGESNTVEGSSNKVLGDNSHVEGQSNTGSGNSVHVEGQSNKGYGIATHVEGQSNEASNTGSHAEGTSTKATGWAAHAEGYNTQSTAYASHAEGNYTRSTAQASHSEGCYTQATARGAHAEGDGDTSEGRGIASGQDSHSEGYWCNATDLAGHAEGKTTTSSGTGSHSEGYETTSSSTGSHSEGMYTQATESGAHAEGRLTTASGFYSHAEGQNTISSGDYSHSGGAGLSDQDGRSLSYGGSLYIDLLPTDYDNKTSTYYEFTQDTTITHVILRVNPNPLFTNIPMQAEALSSGISWTFEDTTSGSTAITNKIDIELDATDDNVVELKTPITITLPSGSSYARINRQISSNSIRYISSSGWSISDYYPTISVGTEATSEGSYAHGFGAQASGDSYQTVIGCLNEISGISGYAFIVGNGKIDPNLTEENSVIKSNAMTVDWNGNQKLAGKLTIDGTPTEDNDVVTIAYLQNYIASLEARITALELGGNNT